MGYTHYWQPASGGGEIKAVDWEKIRQDAVRLFAACEQSSDTRIAFEEDSNAPPIADGSVIRFNGTPCPNGHETFLLDRVVEGYTFCKTAQKPYDKVVICILACANEHAPYAIKITSDGRNADWKDGLAWGSEILGRELRYPVLQRQTA